MALQLQRQQFHSISVCIETLTGNHFYIHDLDPNDTISCIKYRIQAITKISIKKQQIMFRNRYLNHVDSIPIKQLHIKNNSTLVLVLRLNTAPTIIDHLCKDSKVYIEHDPLENIHISFGRFKHILDDILIYDIDYDPNINNNKLEFDVISYIHIPLVIIEIIYSYSHLIGSKRPIYEKYEWNELHSAAYYGDLKKCELLLMKSYYIDQYTHQSFVTPLILSVMQSHILLTEFLLINGARRRIKYLITKLLKDGSNCSKLLNDRTRFIMLSMLMQYSKYDPVNEKILWKK